MLSEANKNWKLLSVCDEIRWTHIIKQSSCATGFHVDRMLIWSVSLCPSSLEKATPWSAKAGVPEQVGWKLSSSEGIQAVHLFPAGGEGKQRQIWGALNWLDTDEQPLSLMEPRNIQLMGARSSTQPHLSWATLASRFLKCLKNPDFYPMTSFQLKAVVYSQPKT